MNNSPSQPLPIQKQLFKEPQSCPYCLMKEKFGLSEKKCLEHSLKDDATKQSNDNLGEEQYLNAEQMAEMLEDIEEGLDYYWKNLRTLSQGDPTKIQKQLEPVLLLSKRVQQRIHKFFYDDTTLVSEFKSSPKTVKYRPSGSQHFSKQQLQKSYNIFGNETESIKEWVMHFMKAVQCRKIIEPIDGLLPFQDQDLEMRIFKESMQRKFLNYGLTIQKHQNKIQQLLNKLIFYMEKSSETVPSETIHNDILFIQNNPEIETSQFEVKSFKLLHSDQRKSHSLEQLLANTSSLVRTEEDLQKISKQEELFRMLGAQASCIETMLEMESCQ